MDTIIMTIRAPKVTALELKFLFFIIQVLRHTQVYMLKKKKAPLSNKRLPLNYQNV